METRKCEIKQEIVKQLAESEALGCPCHEGAGDLNPPTSRKSKEKKRKGKKGRHDENPRPFQLVKQYRDARCDIRGR